MRCLWLWVVQCLFLLCQGVEEKELEWWETTVFYQIYPRSFMDSNGDGIGDLNGIISKLEYVKQLGVGAVWLSPIFKSPMYDWGYDVADHYDIDEDYGTMVDFDRLLERAKELDIKIILDFIPNHTSNESMWFTEALKGNEKYYNYFIWEDGIVGQNGVRHPPNNWVSVFRKSAWEYREEVNKYYLHQMVIGQPDLNYRNPDVIEEMTKILRFWLEKGISGVRVGAVSHLFEVDKNLFGGKYPDEPIKDATKGPDSYNYLDHIYTKNQEETYDIVYKWREVIDDYKAKDGIARVMMTEAYATPQLVMEYFGKDEHKGSHIPSNYVLISDINRASSAAEVKYALDAFITFKPVDGTPNWVAANHDYARVASRFSSELVDGINMIVLLMPGIAITYLGDEIGMVDAYVSWEDTLDPGGCNTDDPINYGKFSRDPARSPFQWNSEINAGFSNSSKTWLPVADGYETLNVAVQENAERSHLKVYKSLVILRTEKAFQRGRYESIALNEGVFAFRRWYNNENYVIVVNFRTNSYSVDLSYLENVTGSLETIVPSVQSTKHVGDIFEAENFPVKGYESVVSKVV